MNRDVLSATKKYDMLSYGDKIVVGLSGGADSVCLTHALVSLRDSLSLEVEAVHVNHGIRGEEALRDEKFCSDFCKSLGIKLTVFRFDIPLECKKTGESEEECGRRKRYECFKNTAGENAKIATAHNLNDSAETVLLNIVRGTGCKGLCGIPPIRGNIIRPLIMTSRDDIELYCKENSLDFVTDSTNLQNEYKRNVIRNVVFPTLQKMNPSVLSAFSRLTENATDDEKLIEEIAELKYSECKTSLGLDEEKLSGYPKALRRRILMKFLSENIKKDISAVHVYDAENTVGTAKSITLPGKIILAHKDGSLVLSEKTEENLPFSVTFNVKDGIVEYPYGKLKIQIFTQKDLQNLNKVLLDNAVDCDKIGNVLSVRSRKEGDKFSSARRKNTKTLKKLFNEAKIPQPKRVCIPVVSSGEKTVWVEGFGTSSEFRVDKGTRKFIIITGLTGEN